MPTRPSEPRCPQAKYVNPANHFFGEKRRLGICIKLPAGNHMNVLAARGEIKGEIAEELTRRRVVGEEKSIEENQALHGDPAYQKMRAPVDRVMIAARNS